MKAEPGAVRAAGEGVLQLVSVPVLRLRGDDRLERWVGEPADPDQRVAHLRVLRLDLARVGVVLEAAATAGAEVRARRLDSIRAGLEELRPRGLGKPALDLRRAGANEVTGKPAANEHDESVESRHPIAAVSE